VTILFLGYGGASFYFNYYLHNINDEAVSMFFVLNKRNIYATSASLFIKEATTNGDKKLVSHNVGTCPSFTRVAPGGKMYLLDMVDSIMKIESHVLHFQKYASDWIYGNYLALARRADSSELCAVSDAFNFSQTLRTTSS
jgi:hypothetical protein